MSSSLYDSVIDDGTLCTCSSCNDSQAIIADIGGDDKIQRIKKFDATWNESYD